jgi:hypothetical protein
MISSVIVAQEMPRLVAELNAQLAESAKLEHLSFVALTKNETIKANLPARCSAQREGGRGLGYGG